MLFFVDTLLLETPGLLSPLGCVSSGFASFTYSGVSPMISDQAQLTGSLLPPAMFAELDTDMLNRHVCSQGIAAHNVGSSR